VIWKPMVMRIVFCFSGLLPADSDPFVPEGCICTLHQPARPAEARPSVHGQHSCLHTRADVIPHKFYFRVKFH
jgi:hypothetical protein